jgi:molecular chaperone GrpE
MTKKTRMNDQKKEPARNASHSDAVGKKKYPEQKKDDKDGKGDKGNETGADCKKMAEKYLDSWKRCQADFENYKKAQTKHQEEFRKYAKMDVIEQVLPVVDNFEASLAHVPEAEKDNKWVEGLVYIKRQLEDVLRNNSVEEIEVKTGDEFNPEIHEAVAGKGEKVKKVLQKGYRMNGRVVRAARVEVG